MNPSPSMAALAKAANVAKSTVSLALRDDPRVAPELRTKIKALAEKMGYQTNALVSRLMYELRTARKQKYVATLALINASYTPDLDKLISNVRGWLDGAEQRAQQLGYAFDHFWLRDPEVSVARLARILYARNVQGVVFYGLHNENNLLDCASLWKHFPCVTIGSRLRNPALHFVSNDHYSTSRQVCEQLTLRGYTRIGIVLDRWIDDFLEHRFVAGYHEYLIPRKQHLPILYLEDLTETPRLEGQRKFKQWVEKYRPDVCICLNKFILDWVDKLSLKIPSQMGVAFLDLQPELQRHAAGMMQQSKWTGMTAADVLIGQIMRHEIGIPAFQRGTMIESQWCDGPSVCKPSKAAIRKNKKVVPQSHLSKNAWAARSVSYS